MGELASVAQAENNEVQNALADICLQAL